MQEAHKKILRKQHLVLFVINAVLNGLFVLLLNRGATGIPVMAQEGYSQSILADTLVTGILLCFLITLLVPLHTRKEIRLGALPTISPADAGSIAKLPQNKWLLSTLMGLCGVLAGLLLTLLLSFGAAIYSIPAYVAIKVVFACVLTALCVQVALVSCFVAPAAAGGQASPPEG